MCSLKEYKLTIVRSKISQLASFLEPYLLLANAHNCDFILEQHWKTMIPTRIADELLALNDKELSVLPGGTLYGDKKVNLLQIESDILNKFHRESERVEIDHRQHSSNVPNFKEVPSEELVGIANERGSSVTTADFEMCKNGFCQTRTIDTCCSIPLVSRPPPEWDKTLIPLWQHDSLQHFISDSVSHTLPCLGVLTSMDDIRRNLLQLESSVSAHSVVKHSMKVKKSYEIDIMTELCAALAKQYNVRCVVDVGSGRGYLGCHLALMHQLCVLGIDSSPSNTGAAIERTRRMQKRWHSLAVKGAMPNGEKQSHSAKVMPKVSVPSANLHTSITHFVNADTDLVRLVSDYLSCEGREREELTCHSSGSQPQLMLTGLHTCGDLSASVLQLYTKTPSCAVVCQVGCCYNLMSEKFSSSPYESRDAESYSERGFPLCQLLQESRYQLGRNARMLACHSPERAANTSELPSPGIYWRSLLQVILHDVVGHVRDDWRVGKIAAKFTCFKDYAHKALKRLGVTAEISEDLLDDYVAKYAEDAWRNIAFFQLKMVLGPCIESLILLDRLAYLLEQEAIADAHLVQVFDVVTSPRCYAIIAIKT